jgi:hypothetical protein
MRGSVDNEKGFCLNTMFTARTCHPIRTEEVGYGDTYNGTITDYG